MNFKPFRIENAQKLTPLQLKSALEVGGFNEKRCTDKTAILTGVLLLERSYGRDEKNRLLFQCVPYDNELSTFLIPYEIKIGFQKTVINKYVLFSFVAFKKETPVGILRQVLGDVSSLTAYYDYLLYSTGLFKNKSWEKQPVDILYPPVYCNFDYSSSEKVFTIDNPETVDFDDAFRFELLDNNECCVSVYITDVATLIFKGLGDNVSRDDVFSNVSSLYMPHRRIPMLLNQITKQVSLVAGSFRFCIVVRFFYDFKTGSFLRSHYSRVSVKVEKNWTYSDLDLISNDLLSFTRRLIGNNISSKMMVAFWMVQYNRFMSDSISDFCFRKKHRIMDNWMTRILEQQEYSLLGSGNDIEFSCFSGDDWICPMTNPIRKKTDLYNQAILLQVVSLTEDEGKLLACNLNIQMKTVSKIQRNTQLLHFMEHHKTFETEGVVYRVEPISSFNNRCFVYLNVGGGLGLFSSFKVLRLCTNNSPTFIGDKDNGCVKNDLSFYETLIEPVSGRFKLFYFSKSHDLKKKICVSPV